MMIIFKLLVGLSLSAFADMIVVYKEKPASKKRSKVFNEIHTIKSGITFKIDSYDCWASKESYSLTDGDSVSNYGLSCRVQGKKSPILINAGHGKCDDFSRKIAKKGNKVVALNYEIIDTKSKFIIDIICE